MKAIAYYDYGPPDVLRCEETEKPTAGDDQVLIKVRAASVNPRDWRFMRGAPYLIRIMTGMRRPRPETTRLGSDLAGQVEAAGRNVTEFRAGDEVFGASLGAFGEYVCAGQKDVALKPVNMTFEQAAAVPTAGLTALQALRDAGKVQPGQNVLINGAAGGVGTFAVQLAKWLGADVTGVCSTRNVEMVRSIGADHVVDYTTEDFTRGDRRYDLIVDSVGNRPLLACRRVMAPKGTLLVVGDSSKGRWFGPLLSPLKAMAISPFVSQTLTPFFTKWNKPDLITMKALLEARTVSPVIDATYPLNKAAEAIRYLEEGHARGKVVITPWK